MIDPNAVCINCGQPAAARRGIINRVYKCGDCYTRDERRGWLLALISCGGCLGIMALMVIMTACGVAAGVTYISK